MFDDEMEYSVQFTVHTANHYTVPELVELAEVANDGGFSKVWVNDNLRYRNQWAVLSAIGSNVPIKLGTGIMVPWYRNPVDTADAIATLTELNEGLEFSFGIGRGDFGQTSNQVDTPHPYRMVRETAEFTRALLDGRSVRFGDYPLLTSYFNLDEEHALELAFEPKADVRTYMAGHGPVSLEVAGKFTDGLLFGAQYKPLLAVGQLGEHLQMADEAAKEVDEDKQMRNIAQIQISVAEDSAAATAFAKKFTSHFITHLDAKGFSDEEYDRMNVDPSRIREITKAFEEGATIEETIGMVTDEMVDAVFIHGTVEECIEQIRGVSNQLADLGFQEIALGKLGPDYDYAIRALAEQVVPAITD